MTNSLTRMVGTTISMLNSMVKSGEVHDKSSIEILIKGTDALDRIEESDENELRKLLYSVKHSIENCKLDNHGVLLGDELEEKIMNL